MSLLTWTTFSLYSSVDEHLDHFHFLAIVGSTAVMHVQAFPSKNIESYMLKNGVIESYGSILCWRQQNSPKLEIW